MVLGNEIADWLAECGTTGHSVTRAQMTQWIDQCGRRRDPYISETLRRKG